AFSASYADEMNRTEAEIATRVTPAADGSLCVFGAWIDEQLAGIVAFIRPQRAKLQHGAGVAGMYVAPELRRRRVGRDLLDAVIAHARSVGVRQLKLSVNAVNSGARRLYESAGFECYGVEPAALQIDGTYYDEAHYFLHLPARGEA
ncbi:MAG TPA: GNAT family N-acetyltransferase, partial [Povalibacter sp.]|nr:GNAT family N-acetyltransferase [Povalibacter sp.]